MRIFLNKTSIRNKGLKCIEFVDNAFDSMFSRLRLDAADIEYMRKIDGAIIYDNYTYISDIDGTRQSLKNLSTGCKTLILLNHSLEFKWVVNISECGTNALNEAFRMDNVNIYMPKYMVPSYIPYEKPVEVLKNKMIYRVTFNELLNELRNGAEKNERENWYKQ